MEFGLELNPLERKVIKFWFLPVFNINHVSLSLTLPLNLNEPDVYKPRGTLDQKPWLCGRRKRIHNFDRCHSRPIIICMPISNVTFS